MMQTEKNAPDFKKIVQKTIPILICIFAAVYFILAVFLFVVSVKTPPENTLEVLGYKIYCAEENVEGTEIKSGSLVVLKNTDNDEFYSLETIKNDALVIPKLGLVLKNDMGIITFSIAVVFALVYAMVFFTELYKKITKQKNEEIEFEFSENDELEIDEPSKDKSTDM